MPSANTERVWVEVPFTPDQYADLLKLVSKEQQFSPSQYVRDQMIELIAQKLKD